MQLIISIIHMCKLWTVSATAGTNEPIVLKRTAEFGCLQSSDTTKCRDATSSVILHYSPPPFHLKCDWLLNKCADMSVPMCQRRAHTHIHTKQKDERRLGTTARHSRDTRTTEFNWRVSYVFQNSIQSPQKRKKQRRRFKIKRSVLDSQNN